MAKSQQIEQDMRAFQGEMHIAGRRAKEQAKTNQCEIYIFGGQVQRIDSGVNAAMGDLLYALLSMPL